METNKTNRGFSVITFVDSNGEGCSLQKSSWAEADAIWLGVDSPKVKALQYDHTGIVGGWIELDIPEYAHIMPSRMHLTQEQVADLLPFLQKFAETGELT